MANPPRPDFNVPDAIGYECKHAVYSVARDGSPHDLLTIKEKIHFPGGITKNRLSFYGNYRRKFWTTKKEYQDHSDKKEWERLKRCDEFSTTQIEMPQRVVQALGFGDPKHGMRRLSSSQFLYGSDISTPCLIKANYMTTWPSARSPNDVAVLDLETNVNTEEQYPITGQLTFRDKALLAVDKNWFEPSVDPVKEIREAFMLKLFNDEHVGPRIQPRMKLEDIEIVMVDGPVELIKVLFDRAHKWQPDIIEIWNQNFDIPRILNCLRDFGVDPTDILCDPRVPRKFRRCEYEEGATRKKAASGREIGINPAEQWHTLRLTAGFYVICGMCGYKRVRLAGGNDFSYGLDDVLKRECKPPLGKIRHASDLLLGVIEGSFKWHDVMQTSFKAIYCAYALWDCVSTEILDETTKDVSTMISTLCSWSEYSNYNRQPTMLVNDLHFFTLARGLVIGTGGKTVSTELDEETLDLTGWIVSLPAYMIVDNGLPVFKNAPFLRSMLRAHVADLDVKSAYPYGGIIMNISRETTQGELCGIEGVDEVIQRRSGINLMSATTNAVEICTDIYKVPQLSDLLASFEEDNA
jgi:hypothetical protein